MCMFKRFSEWIKVKEKLHFSSNVFPLFKEGEIWWCSVGDNVGTEINGKSKDFTRPVLIFRRFSRESFFALPLTSKNKSGIWFTQILFKQKPQTIVLNQGRTLNARRLHSLMGQIDEKNFSKIKDDFRRLYLDIPSQKRRSWEIPKDLFNFSKLISAVKSFFAKP